MFTSRDAETIAEIADLDLVDHHCHGVSVGPLDYDDFASLLTEGGREMLGAIDPIAIAARSCHSIHLRTGSRRRSTCPDHRVPEAPVGARGNHRSPTHAWGRGAE